MKTQFLYFNLLDCFLNLKNIVSRRIKECGKIQTFSGKFEIKAQRVDQFVWIKFRGPILMVWSTLHNFRFVGLFIGSQSTVFLLGPHFEATRNFSGPEKIRGPISVSLICVPKCVTKNTVHNLFNLSVWLIYQFELVFQTSYKIQTFYMFLV